MLLKQIKQSVRFVAAQAQDFEIVNPGQSVKIRYVKNSIIVFFATIFAFAMAIIQCKHLF